MANLLSRLAPKGYPGLIFVLKLRYGYGTQQIIEKLEILDSWYSCLDAYLPIHLEKKQDEYTTYIPELEEIRKQLDGTYEMYDGVFEGQSCSQQEKNLLKVMRGIKYRLDKITAKSGIIDNIRQNDDEGVMAG